MQRHGYGPLFQEVVNIAIIFVVKFLHVSINRLKETKTNMEYGLNFLDGHQLNNLIVCLLSKVPFHGWKRADRTGNQLSIIFGYQPLLVTSMVSQTILK